MNEIKSLSPHLPRIGDILHNLSRARLYEAAICNQEAKLSAEGALVAETGAFTGRSPDDRFIVERETVQGIDWGAINKPLKPAHFSALLDEMQTHLAEKTVYVQDLFCGADPKHRLKIRVITEQAWHSLFAQNMFIMPNAAERTDFKPDFTVIQAPSLKAYPARHGTRSSTFVALDFEEKLVLIGGTGYAGEIKKSIFSVMNYLLPDSGILPMHCSANVGKAGDVAIFFGLSGTGKTTLSATVSRILIGDDEHGWSAGSVFNFEGGCYAKAIRLSATEEPEIHAATQRFGTILENTIMDEASRIIDYDDASLTENTRASYPLDFIPNASKSGRAGQPRNIVMLTCDAFGILPPVARLTPDQARYHFLSGYTARVAGTERGVKEPTACFSACFGAPFMPRHPAVYADLLGKRMTETGANCWLINTGWIGGAYGTGERIKLKYTRAMVEAALDGRLGGAAFETEPHFGLAIPTSCPDVPADILNPAKSWADPEQYAQSADRLASMFESNFKQFEDMVDEALMTAAIRPVAAVTA